MADRTHSHDTSTPAMSDETVPSAQDYEAVARQRGWRTKREDGSLAAGVIRYGRTGGGFQWAGDWKEACSLDGIGSGDIRRLLPAPNVGDAA